MATPVQMPKQGNTVEECLINAWHVQEGATVSEGDVLCEIETDKATFEVESPAAGTVLKLFFAEGDLVPVLTNIAVLGDAGEDASEFAPDGAADSAPKAEEAPAPQEKAESAAAPAPSSPAQATGELRISPRARNLSVKLGVDPQAVAGTGPHGRIVSADIQAAADSGLRMTPAARAAAAGSGLAAGAGTGIGGRVRTGDLVAPGAAAPQASAAMPDIGTPVEIPYRGIRKLIGDRMRNSLLQHAQLTMNAQADAGPILAFRKKVKAQGEALGLPNITINDIVAAVLTRTLLRFPELNAIFDFDNEKVIQYPWVHLAVAVDTERGLMVPVVRNAQALSLAALSKTIADYATQCRSGSIDPDLLQGGTITITNLGPTGVTSFTPVLNSPQVAILGVTSITRTAVPDGSGGVAFKSTLGLSLTIDHQVVDGSPAARFLQALVQGLENFDLMLAQ